MCQDICDLLPILYQSGFNTEGFQNLEQYLYKTVGSLPYQSLLRLALDSVFEEFPEISAIQTKVYRMLKCHLSIINHSSITQFDDITLSYHDFDRVAGANFHNVSGSESRPDLSLQTDFNETYYSVTAQLDETQHRTGSLYGGSSQGVDWPTWLFRQRPVLGLRCRARGTST